MMIAVALVVAIGIALTWVGFRCLRRKRLIENVPTSKVKGVFLGLTEIKGRIRSDTPLVIWLAERRCVHYAYSIEERWERTVVERDAKGRTRKKSGWTTVDSCGETVPFDLEDETGRLLVDPAGAEIQGVLSHSRTCGRSDPDYHEKGPTHAVSNSTHRRRFTEHLLPLGADAYVMGGARLREDVVAPMIAHDPEAEMFLVSVHGEESLTRRYGWSALGTLPPAALAAWALPVVLALPQGRALGDTIRDQLEWSLAAVGIDAVVVATFALILIYNGLVSVRDRVEMAWSMIDVQLKRRHDLIPRLVTCVKGVSTYEGDVQERLAALRASGATGSAVEDGSALASRQGQTLRAIFALAEGHPEIEADASFRALHATLVDAEDRIALAREFYNSTVDALNTRIQTFPDVLVARPGGFRPRPFFAKEGLETSPR